LPGIEAAHVGPIPVDRIQGGWEVQPDSMRLRKIESAR
jgi:hypothetical protein